MGEEGNRGRRLLESAWRRCPLGEMRGGSFCSDKRCVSFKRIEAHFGTIARRRARMHHENTGVHVEPERFLSNACRVAPFAVPDTSAGPESALRRTLASEDLYFATALAAGDNRAWTKFMDLWRPKTRALCRMAGMSILEGDLAVTDLAFDLYAVAALARYKSTGPLDRWLLRCAKIATLRRRTELQSRTLPPAACSRFTTSPLRAAAQSEMQTLLKEGLRSLPVRDREALRLRWEQGLTLHEVATRLELSFPMQASRLLDRASLRLRRLVERAARKAAGP